ncbi:MAG: heme exporter protein CcmB [Xanthomonadaceae bacterium]|nr:heme exporter protein CcmB [Xanthomonadaceae bacterium]
MSMLAAVVQRDLRLAWRRWPEFALPPLFVVLVASLFPLGISPSQAVLELIAPGVVWVAALLAALLGLELLFRPDYDDGALELLALSPHPLAAMAASRIAVHWLVTGVPILAVAPLVALMYSVPLEVLGVLMLGLLIGTPLLSLIGGIAAALTVSLKRSAPLLALLVLPLCIPVLIFGTRATALASSGLSAAAALYLLGAMLVLGVTLAPLAAGAALRISLE